MHPPGCLPIGGADSKGMSRRKDRNWNIWLYSALVNSFQYAMWVISEAAAVQMETWLFFVLPLLAALLGALSNTLAQRLLFGPLPFGDACPPALVAAAGPVASRLALGMGRTLRPGELFRLMEPEKVAAAVALAVNARLDEHVDDIMRERNPVLWDNLPQLARQRVYRRVERQLPSLLDNVVEELGEHMDELTDLRQLLQDVTDARRELLPALLEEALAEECRFLRRAGLAVGLLGGLLQALAWSSYPLPWLLVLLAMASAVASLTLPLALLYRTGPVPWLGAPAGQGLARVFASRLCGDVFSARHLLHAVVTGPRAPRARSIIRRHMRPLLETGMVRTTLQLLLGVQSYAHIKEQVADRLTALTVSTLEAGPLDDRQGERVEAACRACLESLPPTEMRALVQPVLDEGLWWRLLAVAGLGLLLGLAEAGLLQGLSGG